MFIHKYDYKQKIKIITKYQNETYGLREIRQIYGMSRNELNDWIRLYKTFGPSGLKTNSTASNMKQMALTQPEKISSFTVVNYLRTIQ